MKRCLLLLVAGLLTSCSGAKYNREWQAALTQPAKGINGCWQGTWISEVNGHNGALRCIVSESTKTEHEYRFHYHATWGKFFQGAFSVECRADRQPDGTWKVQAGKDLGRAFGGVFDHTATITPKEIQARYSAKLDRGRMELTRPAVPSGNATKSATP